MAEPLSTIVSIPSSPQPLPTHNRVMEKTKHETSYEEGPDSPSYFQKILAEILGTYIFVFAGCGAVLVDREKPRLTFLGLAIVPALALMTMIYAVGHISGAHFNPAVTIAFTVARKLPLIQAPMYIGSQMFGSTLASLILRVLFKDQGNILPILTQYSSSITDVEACIWEFLLTFMLMFTICGVASDNRANSQLCGVAIGGALLLNILIAGPITGASMNPARSLGPAIVSGVYKNQWVYVVAPILGATLASLMYNLLRKQKPRKRSSTDNNIYNDLYLYPSA